ncbi:MAG: GTPase ObgE [Acidobacteriota bacterium]|nr:GTPase ObgE [Acidobacteriota bacterium]
MFVDEVDIHVKAGDGGDGCMAFRREKFVPRGGPSGGNGGVGGSIYLVASPHHNTLVTYRFHPEFKAQRGRHGEGSNCTGAGGDDLELAVPPGTVVYEKTPDGDQIFIADLTEVGQRVLVARGGDGGRGNAEFATATNRAPRRCEPGWTGEERVLQLRLKLLADVGLVGYPNGGKSTLISRISAARPKIADYPFTTLTPNLGVVSMTGERSFVVADVPGLIEGAHEGHGLGHQFLSHLERTKVLVHVIDMSETGRDPVQDFDVITRELALFAGRGDETAVALADKPRLVAANKIDAMPDPKALEKLKKHLKKKKVPLFAISAATGNGLQPLLEAMWKEVGPLLPPPSEQETVRLKPSEIAEASETERGGAAERVERAGVRGRAPKKEDDSPGDEGA